MSVNGENNFLLYKSKKKWNFHIPVPWKLAALRRTMITLLPQTKY